MTKAQIWVAAFVGSFILLYFVQKFTTPTPATETKPGMEQVAAPESPSAGSVDPKILLAKFSCKTCHGSDFKGGASGPSLFDLANYYSEGKLIAFIQNSAASSSEQRHQERVGKYPKAMPDFSGKDVKEIKIIADYLLTLSSQ